MPIREEVPVNPAILLWAREQAGFSLTEAVTKAHIGDLKLSGISALERLSRWENGTDHPTLNELKSLAKAYRRPLLTFFLSAQPIAVRRLEDFRTFSDRRPAGFSPEFSAFIRKIDVLQQELKEILLEEGVKPLAFVGGFSADINPIQFAEEIRNVLDFPFAQQERVGERESLFNILRDKAEHVGIFVLRQADLGSHHSKIELSEFRGLTFSDPIAPIIVVNPGDSQSALLFTLIHELTHLFLGDSAISNDDTLYPNGHERIERETYCNAVAAEFLVPSNKLFESIVSQQPITRRLIEKLANKFKVSQVVIGRRLLEYSFIDTDTYWDLYNQCKDEWLRLRQSYSENQGGPGYFILTRSKLGNKLLNTILGAAIEGRLSYSSASSLLNVKVNHFDELLTG